MSRKDARSLWAASESTHGVACSSRMRSLMHLFPAGGVARELYGWGGTRAALWRVLEAVVGGICDVCEGVGSRLPAGVWVLE